MTQAEYDQHDCSKGLEDGCTCDGYIIDSYNSVTGEHEELIYQPKREEFEE